MAPRVYKIGIKANKVREIMNQIVNYTHVIVAVNTGKLYPLAAENLVIGETNSKY